MQQEGKGTAAFPFIAKDSGNVGISVPGMDGQRHASQPGRADMGAEIRLLHIPRRPVIEVVEARFPNPDHGGMLRHGGKRFRVWNWRFRRVMGMHADRAPKPSLLPRDHVRQPPGLLESRANGDEFRDACFAGPLQHLRQLSAGVVIQVAMRIYQHQAFRLPVPHNAGTPPEVAAEPYPPADEH